jgi:hypothetical protein
MLCAIVLVHLYTCPIISLNVTLNLATIYSWSYVLMTPQCYNRIIWCSLFCLNTYMFSHLELVICFIEYLVLCNVKR